MNSEYNKYIEFVDMYFISQEEPKIIEIDMKNIHNNPIWIAKNELYKKYGIACS